MSLSNEIIEFASYNWREFKIIDESNVSISTPDIILIIVSYLPWKPGVVEQLVAEGNLLVLKWALKNGCPRGTNICTEASKHGILSVLKFGHENEFPWDEQTTNMACYGGYLNCLRYAIENGCPWNEWECANLSFVQHVNEHKCLLLGKNWHDPNLNNKRIDQRFTCGHYDCANYIDEKLYEQNRSIW